MSKTAVIGLSLALAAGAASTFADEPVQIHGFVGQAYVLSSGNAYLAPNSKDGSFDLNELGVNFGISPTDRLRIGVQFFARDLGDFGNDTITVDWAFGDYRVRDWFGVRAGKIRMPLGLYGEIRDTDALRTSALLPQAVYNETFREVLIGAKGVGVYGEVPADGAGSFSYQALAGSVNVPANGAVEGAFEVWVQGVADMTTSQAAKVYMGQFEWRPPLEGLRFAVSNLAGDWGMAGRTTVPLGPLPAGTPVAASFDDYNQFIGSAEYVWKDLTLASEYIRTSYDASLPPLFENRPVREEGYYASAAYRFSKLFEAGSYYSVFWGDRDDKDGSQMVTQGRPTWAAWQKDLALTLRFDITKGFIAKLEGHIVDGTAQLIIEPATAEQDWSYLVARVSYTF